MVDFYNYSADDVLYEVESITRSGSTATLTTKTPHNFQNTDTPIVEGALEIEYDGEITPTVTGPYTLTYTVSGTPATPATGIITIRSGTHRYLSTQTEYQPGVLPANATYTAPPSPGVDEIAIFDTGLLSWSLTDDFRGQIYYLPSEDYQEYTQEVVGPFPDTAVTSIPLSTLKERKIDDTYGEFLFQIQKNITVSAVTYFADYGSIQQYNLLSVEDGALTTKPTKLYLPNRTIKTASKANLESIREAWAVRVNESYNNFESLVNAINAAADETALNAIDITAGWPA